MKLVSSIMSNRAAPIARFDTVESLWFWVCEELKSRRQSRQRQEIEYPWPLGKSARKVIRRPCTVEQVLKEVDRLWRHLEIDLSTAEVMREWGDKGIAPDPLVMSQRSHHRLWRIAMDALGPVALRLNWIAFDRFDGLCCQASREMGIAP